MNVQDKMRRFMNDHGYKQRTIARKMGMHPVTFNNILNGKRYVKGDELIDFCNAVEITVDELKRYQPKEVNNDGYKTEH